MGDNAFIAAAEVMILVIDAGVRAMSSLRLATTSPVVMSITQTPAFAPRIAFDCAKSSAAFALIPPASSVCGSSNVASSIAANFEIYLVIFFMPLWNRAQNYAKYKNGCRKEMPKNIAIPKAAVRGSADGGRSSRRIVISLPAAAVWAFRYIPP